MIYFDAAYIAKCYLNEPGAASTINWGICCLLNEACHFYWESSSAHKVGNRE
jgi:hypothetical protein